MARKLFLLIVITVLALSGCSAQEDRYLSAEGQAQATRAALQEIPYTPESMTRLQSATLTWTLAEENHERLHVSALTDEKGLGELEQLLREAQIAAACPAASVGHELTLIRQDGAVTRLLVAADGSCILRADDQYYSFHPSESVEGGKAGDSRSLYRLFGAAL